MCIICQTDLEFANLPETHWAKQEVHSKGNSNKYTIKDIVSTPVSMYEPDNHMVNSDKRYEDD